MKLQSRRNFFRQAGVGTAAFAGAPLLSGAALADDQFSKVSHFFSEGEVLLFQGDSITDAGRNKERELPNTAGSFGTGYALLTASWLLEELAQKKLTIYNRGISGNKVFQLADRWEKDCLALEPDVLSILIGVNDYWHMRNGRYDGTPEVFENDYRALLQRTKSSLPGIRLVICQPFILPGTSAVDESWIKPFNPYQEIAERMAKEFDAVWVPFQEAFNQATQCAPATYWAGDGVHPSMAGAQLMAETWLNAVAAAV
jgi:lysophospholipase L1-like esterase